MKQLSLLFTNHIGQQEIREIKDLYIWGMPIKTIAHNYTVTNTYISLLARQHGWPMRYAKCQRGSLRIRDSSNEK